ncbi:hypothetical protein ASPTUDRAFT_44209 [Aspergillus tubingensis CBS 134.48]|uniref:Uncharacterized protein n=1 Tax=Aspergillus tubingensis (strain CBS 134.48) TaxID=767770 RepID=A0A1L9N0T6_ASPTC|nr:hypothetical protein ASPTUDRAFT_44209 [Aspergillus tubingensis CBS 134.48]
MTGQQVNNLSPFSQFPIPNSQFPPLFQPWKDPPDELLHPQTHPSFDALVQAKPRPGNRALSLAFFVHGPGTAIYSSLSANEICWSLPQDLSWLGPLSSSLFSTPPRELWLTNNTNLVKSICVAACLPLCQATNSPPSVSTGMQELPASCIWFSCQLPQESCFDVRGTSG